MTTYPRILKAGDWGFKASFSITQEHNGPHPCETKKLQSIGNLNKLGERAQGPCDNVAGMTQKA